MKRTFVFSCAIALFFALSGQAARGEELTKKFIKAPTTLAQKVKMKVTLAKVRAKSPAAKVVAKAKPMDPQVESATATPMVAPAAPSSPAIPAENVAVGTFLLSPPAAPSFLGGVLAKLLRQAYELAPKYSSENKGPIIFEQYYPEAAVATGQKPMILIGAAGPCETFAKMGNGTIPFPAQKLHDVADLVMEQVNTLTRDYAAAPVVMQIGCG